MLPFRKAGGDGGVVQRHFRPASALLAAEAAATGEAAPWIGLLETNAESLWRRGRLDGSRPLFGERWDAPAGYPVELSTQLSGVMLLEAMTRIA